MDGGVEALGGRFGVRVHCDGGGGGGGEGSRAGWGNMVVGGKDWGRSEENKPFLTAHHSMKSVPVTGGRACPVAVVAWRPPLT
jgi:hypothetical protein